MNSAIALQLLIELTMQAQRLAQMLQTAKNENRDISRDELQALRMEDISASKRLQELIDSKLEASDNTFGDRN